MKVICAKREQDYFCERDWTGESVICPTGATRRTVLEENYIVAELDCMIHLLSGMFER
jgi:hypothetical protein